MTTDTTPEFDPGIALDHCSMGWLTTGADAQFPDSKQAESFLDGVLYSVIDRADDLLDESNDRSDITHEIADSAVPIYTYDLWKCFVDLGAYNGDMDDLGGAGNDMTKNAQVCLYMMAERLAYALVDELVDAKATWDEEHAQASTCIHCDRAIVEIDGAWVDPEATGDDSIWRETCDKHDTFTAEHEPEEA